MVQASSSQALIFALKYKPLPLLSFNSIMGVFYCLQIIKDKSPTLLSALGDILISEFYIQA